MLSACSVRVESDKKDKEETEIPTGITVVDDGGWTYYQIIDVHGHQYLSNNIKGGLVHLESCKCKSKY